MRRFQIIEEEPLYSPLFFTQQTTSSILVPKTLTFPSFLQHTLHLELVPFDLLTIQQTPSFSYRQVQKHLSTEFCLQSLSDRVSELESRFDRISSGKNGGGCGGHRKYTWTADIKGAEKDGFDRKYKWIADLVEEEKNKLKTKSLKWTAEIKGKGEESGNLSKYTFQVGSGDGEKNKKSEKKEAEKVKEKKKGSGRLRIVEIEEPTALFQSDGPRIIGLKVFLVIEEPTALWRLKNLQILICL